VIGDAGCVEAMMEQPTAQRVELRRRLRRRQVDLEKTLPADVPLHQRGFGVLEEPP
jgi:hypothetical protein